MFKSEKPHPLCSTYWQDEGAYSSTIFKHPEPTMWGRELLPLKQQIRNVNTATMPLPRSTGFYLRTVSPSPPQRTYRHVTSLGTTSQRMPSPSITLQTMMPAPPVRHNVMVSSSTVVQSQYFQNKTLLNKKKSSSDVTRMDDKKATFQGCLKHCVDCVLGKHPKVELSPSRYVELQTPTQRQESGLKVYSVLLARHGFSCSTRQNAAKSAFKNYITESKQTRHESTIAQRLIALKNTAENMTKTCDYLTAGVARGVFPLQTNTSIPDRKPTSKITKIKYGEELDKFQSSTATQATTKYMKHDRLVSGNPTSASTGIQACPIVLKRENIYVSTKPSTILPPGAPRHHVTYITEHRPVHFVSSGVIYKPVGGQNVIK